MDIIGNILVIAGALLLLTALSPSSKLVGQLSAGKLHKQWRILRTLILSFFCGYTLFLLLNWSNYPTLHELIVPIIFFCGAIFVRMVCRLSLQTAEDIKQVYRLQQESITDPLMKIFNRRYMDRRLKEEILRAQRYNLALTVLLLDIDYFKRLNDTHGHHAGDRVLEFLGKLILNTVRDSDIVARYGGEEIMIILPNTDGENGLLLAERLRVKIAHSAIEITPSTTADPVILKITVSIGSAELNKEVSCALSLLQYADKALYQAKEQGRNQVIPSSDLLLLHG